MLKYRKGYAIQLAMALKSGLLTPEVSKKLVLDADEPKALPKS